MKQLAMIKDEYDSTFSQYQTIKINAELSANLSMQASETKEHWKNVTEAAKQSEANRTTHFEEQAEISRERMDNVTERIHTKYEKALKNHAQKKKFAQTQGDLDGKAQKKMDLKKQNKEKTEQNVKKAKDQSIEGYFKWVQNKDKPAPLPQI